MPITRKYSFKLDKKDNSCIFRAGNTVVECNLIRTAAPFLCQSADLRVRFSMLPFGPSEEGSRFDKRSFSNRRCLHIASLLKKVFKESLRLSDHPNEIIYLLVDNVSADGGTRTAALNGLSGSLALSRTSCKSLSTAVSFSQNLSGEICLDVDQAEEAVFDKDCPIGFSFPTEEITLFQIEGVWEIEKLYEGIDEAKLACKKIYQSLVEKLKNEIKK